MLLKTSRKIIRNAYVPLGACSTTEDVKRNHKARLVETKGVECACGAQALLGRSFTRLWRASDTARPAIPCLSLTSRTSRAYA
jgi:hypothetical protein